MNTTQLECFLAVAEYLNFSKAAEAVRLTQPAVSHQMNTLENELGAKLFIRSSKSVRLTRAGIQFLGDASNILKIASGAKARLSEHAAGKPLFLEIGCHNQFEVNLLPKLLEQLSQEFPRFHPAIRLIPFQALENLLESESIHVMFDFKNEHAKKAAGIYQELIKCPVACVCHAESPLAQHTVLSEQELKGDLVLCEPRKGPAAVFQIQNRLSLTRHASEIFFADGYESAAALLKAGIGFTLLPDIPCVREAGLCYIPVSGFEPLSFGVRYKSLSGSPALKRFIQLLKEETACI